MSEKHVFSLAFLTNWDFFCRALRDVVGGSVPRLSPVCPQISSLFWVSVTAERSYPTTGPPGKERGVEADYGTNTTHEPTENRRSSHGHQRRPNCG
jgi:hypothetical protein